MDPIRETALSAALLFHNARVKGVSTVEDVVETAKKFAAFLEEGGDAA